MGRRRDNFILPERLAALRGLPRFVGDVFDERHTSCESR